MFGLTFLICERFDRFVNQLISCQADETAYRYALICSQCIQLQAGHPYLEKIKVPFLKLAQELAGIIILINDL